jgi:hypothetical protein
MRIAIEGCTHGELDKIYTTIQDIEKSEGYKVQKVEQRRGMSRGVISDKRKRLRKKLLAGSLQFTVFYPDLILKILNSILSEVRGFVENTVLFTPISTVVNIFCLECFYSTS